MKTLLFSSAMIGALLFTTAYSAHAGSAKKPTKAELSEKLSEIESIEAFEKLAAEAKASGVSEQAILEAKLIFCIKSDTAAPLVELLPKVESMLNDWKESDSPFFKERYQLEALIHMAKGLVAASADDAKAFEREMKDAFWRDPKLASVVAERVSAFRDKQAMRTVVLPMDLALETSKGEKTTLGELVKGQKALLLDFWASWCSPCMASMSNLRDRAAKLAPQGIRVFGINTESDRAKAEKVRKDKKMSIGWLVEPAERPLSEVLRIDSIPRAVLVTPDGRIAFNGHPEDDALEPALAGLGVTKEVAGATAR